MAKKEDILSAEQQINDILESLSKMKKAADILESAQKNTDEVISTSEELVKQIAVLTSNAQKILNNLDNQDVMDEIKSLDKKIGLMKGEQGNKLDDHTDKLIKLIEKILNKFDFIKKESFSKISSLDKYGSKRIAQTIIGIKQVKYSGPKKNYDKNFLIKRVNIRDINQYLLHRNQKINMKRMINFKKISALDHYNWWLSNDFFARKTFKVISGNKILLYIWHKNIKINNSSYYVGGWFVANKECKISDVYASLKWQLKTTRSKNKKWIAVINMNNKIVLKLNNLLGFSKDFNSKKDYKNSKNFFQVSPKKFSYQIYPT